MSWRAWDSREESTKNYGTAISTLIQKLARSENWRVFNPKCRRAQKTIWLYCPVCKMRTRHAEGSGYWYCIEWRSKALNLICGSNNRAISEAEQEARKGAALGLISDSPMSSSLKTRRQVE
jgi:hypothetical protein